MIIIYFDDILNTIYGHIIDYSIQSLSIISIIYFVNYLFCIYLLNL
jgi:hypothetical protein